MKGGAVGAAESVLRCIDGYTWVMPHGQLNTGYAAWACIHRMHRRSN